MGRSSTSWKRRSARWGAKAEPGDGDRSPEQPRLLRRTIDLLIEENVMPREAISRHIGLAAFDIEKLAGLPEGYLQKKDNVVQFARLRATSADAASPPGAGTVVPFPTTSKR